MIAAGALVEGDPIELLDGVLVRQTTKNPPHQVACTLTSNALRRVVPDGYFVVDQGAVTTDDSEPEPDHMVVRGDPRDLSARDPGAADAVLVVEVADPSLRRDREVKAPLYARAGVQCYWIVNLRERTVEIYGAPTPQGYGSRVDHAPGARITLVLDGREVAEVEVDALLP